jgi:hypothetical protein
MGGSPRTTHSAWHYHKRASKCATIARGGAIVIKGSLEAIRLRRLGRSISGEMYMMKNIDAALAGRGDAQTMNKVVRSRKSSAVSE